MSQSPRLPSLSVVIPTLGRERVLLETLHALLALAHGPDEILVVDQTTEHEAGTDATLRQWDVAGRIRWIRLSQASIPVAMNVGLREALSEVVLFLDDDIVPELSLVLVHRRVHADAGVAGAAGMVLQPGDRPATGGSQGSGAAGLRKDLDFRFNGTVPCEIWNVMAGNLSVKREIAVDCGGFDENFVGVAYRFETEFCRRLRRHRGKVVYEPGAVIHHLKAPSGGTRVWGFHKTSPRPEHSVGDYYFALLEGRGWEAWGYSARRFIRECFSRFHVARPWYVPVKMIGEARGYLMARRLERRKRHAA